MTKNRCVGVRKRSQIVSRIFGIAAVGPGRETQNCRHF